MSISSALNNSSLSDQHYLDLAVEEAHKSLESRDVPVGAIIVHNEAILASAYNQKEKTGDVTAHAEVLAIRMAVKKLGDWRLNGSTLYTTLEPCGMCAGTIIQSRITRVVFGAKDPKGGVFGSVIQMAEPGLFNHTVSVQYIERSDCSALLTTFFSQLRR